MNAFGVGATIKITMRGRHPGVDRPLLDNVDLTKATILDIGASDGSTSVDLIERLPGFKAYVIADLYLCVQARTVRSRTLFYEPGGGCVMVAGDRVVGWQARSRMVGALYREQDGGFVPVAGTDHELDIADPVTGARLDYAAAS